MVKFFWLFTLLSPLSSKAETLLLKFKVSSAEGQVLWGIYKQSDKFPDTGKASWSGIEAVKGNEVIVKLPDFKIGVYAVAASHDVNSNSKMDFNFGVYPKEPFGFSNGARPSVFGAPSFDDSKFNFSSDEQAFEIELKKF